MSMIANPEITRNQLPHWTASWLNDRAIFPNQKVKSAEDEPINRIELACCSVVGIAPRALSSLSLG